jgi:hypothetical protein
VAGLVDEFQGLSRLRNVIDAVSRQSPPELNPNAAKGGVAVKEESVPRH